ncbi:MAG TPA: DNA repair protein RecO [Candidatus Sulfopaludibacter sp.]|nr:DNA repair protein RecO [Candidatus Sulfopaludibacter sp.]
MIQSATGLILRTRPLTETSLIVHWLTPDSGRIATVAKGARRPKSPFLGKLDLFYVADFSFSRSRRSDLHILREIRLRELHVALRQNLASLHQATYATAFVEEATETETPLPAVYDLMLEFLGHLCERPDGPQAVFRFELKLLQELGLKPDWERSRLSPGARNICRVLAQGGWPACLRLKLSHVQIAELQQFLHGFLIFHLGRLPKGRAEALARQDSK